MTCVVPHKLSLIREPLVVRIVDELNELGYTQFRFTCTNDSKDKKAINKFAISGYMMIQHIEPVIPSYNTNTPTFSYDLKLSEFGLTMLQFELL